MCQPGARENLKASCMVPLEGPPIGLMRETVSRGVVARLLVAAAARPGTSRQSSRARTRMGGV